MINLERQVQYFCQSVRFSVEYLCNAIKVSVRLKLQERLLNANLMDV